MQINCCRFCVKGLSTTLEHTLLRLISEIRKKKSLKQGKKSSEKKIQTKRKERIGNKGDNGVNEINDMT